MRPGFRTPGRQCVQESSPSLYSTTSASNSMPSILWMPPMVMPSISIPNLWLRWKSPLVFVSPFRVSRENLTGMIVSPLSRKVEGLGEVDSLVHDLEYLADVARGARVEPGKLPLLRPALVQVDARGLAAVVGHVHDADALALDVALVDRLEPVVELGARRPVALQHQRAHLLAAGADALAVIVGILIGDHLVLVVEAVHLVDAADGDALDLDREPALLVEVAGGVLGAPFEDLTAELHWHSTAPVIAPRGGRALRSGGGRFRSLASTSP